jgi:hypothetical protein
MTEAVPRRLKRFYRDAKEKKVKQEEEVRKENEGYAGFGYEENQDEKKSDLQRIPSMDYEDLEVEADEKNKKEIEEIQRKRSEEKIALSEIEDFKAKNNRLPNEKEEEMLAQKISPEIKANPREAWKNRRLARRDERMQKKENQQEQAGGSDIEGPAPSQETTLNLASVKDLLSDEKNPKSGGEGKEFDLNLGEEEDKGGELEQIAEIDEEGKCPTCKKSADKLIYCSKCGTAFCNQCSKKSENEEACPKCGTRIKKN